MTTAIQELRRRLDAIVQSDHHPYDVQLAIEALGIVERLSAQTAKTEQPSLSDAEIVAAVRDVFSHGTEYTGLTFINSNGAEKPTAAARNLARALLSAQRQDSNMTFSGYFDEDEYQGITIEKFLKHRNESEGMDAWEIGHEFQVDAVYSRTEQWRVTNDVPWTAERIDCAAIANGAPK